MRWNFLPDFRLKRDLKENALVINLNGFEGSDVAIVDFDASDLFDEVDIVLPAYQANKLSVAAFIIFGE